ncbi:hypothetical protein ACWGVR_08130 [Streptomyces xanthophaeus]
MAFIGRVLTEAAFTDCDLSDAVFTDCTLRLTEFGTGRYRNTDLRENRERPVSNEDWGAIRPIPTHHSSDSGAPPAGARWVDLLHSAAVRGG